MTISTTQINVTKTPFGAGTTLWNTTIEAIDNGTETLHNLYEFSDNVSVDGVSATLVDVGVYQQTSGTETATANNGAVFITASQMSGYAFSGGGSGSPTTPQIPGFLIAASLAPEPASTALVTAGGVLLFALRRKRAA